MSKYPKLWPVGGHPEGEAKVRQLQKLGPKWLRASGPGWVAEKQGKLSNVKHEVDSGFILLQFESLTKYKIAPAWAHATIVYVGEEFDYTIERGVYRLTYYNGTTDFEFLQISEELDRDVVDRFAFYVLRADDNGGAYYENVAPSGPTYGIIDSYAALDTERGGLSWYATATNAWLSRAYPEPVLTKQDFQPTRHTVFLDPKYLRLSKYETTFIGPSSLALRRDIAVADKNKNIYFAEYLRDDTNDIEACYLIPKATYPGGKIEFNQYGERDAAGWLFPLSPWHLYIGEFDFVSTRKNSHFSQNAKIVLGKGIKNNSVSVTSQFEHTDPRSGTTSLAADTSSVDAFDGRILAAESTGAICVYNKSGEKVFHALFPGFVVTVAGGSIPEYELAIDVSKGISIWKNKIIAFAYHRFDANNTNYEFVIGGWSIADAIGVLDAGDQPSQLPFDFEIVVQASASPISTVGVCLRENRIFHFAIESWAEGDVLGGTANINRPVVFVYKWGGELIKKIDLFTELELENVGYVDAFQSERTHSIYASPF